MLIRVRCHTCGGLLADKFPLYTQKVKQTVDPDKKDITYFEKGMQKKTVHGLVLDEMGVTRMCCRMAFLSHIG
jgi:DNA-directed RNA polymerase subunit N (RpoN/RPB10)